MIVKQLENTESTAAYFIELQRLLELEKGRKNVLPVQQRSVFVAAAVAAVVGVTAGGVGWPKV